MYIAFAGIVEQKAGIIRCGFSKKTSGQIVLCTKAFGKGGGKYRSSDTSDICVKTELLIDRFSAYQHVKVVAKYRMQHPRHH